MQFHSLRDFFSISRRYSLSTCTRAISKVPELWSWYSSRSQCDHWLGCLVENWPSGPPFWTVKFSCNVSLALRCWQNTPRLICIDIPRKKQERGNVCLWVLASMEKQRNWIPVLTLVCCLSPDLGCSRCRGTRPWLGRWGVEAGGGEGSTPRFCTFFILPTFSLLPWIVLTSNAPLSNCFDLPVHLLSGIYTKCSFPKIDWDGSRAASAQRFSMPSCRFSLLTLPLCGSTFLIHEMGPHGTGLRGLLQD